MVTDETPSTCSGVEETSYFDPSPTKLFLDVVTATNSHKNTIHKLFLSILRSGSNHSLTKILYHAWRICQALFSTDLFSVNHSSES